MGNSLRRELQKLPVEFSLVVKICPGFCEGDLLRLVNFVNDAVSRARQEELPARLEFGGSEILLRRYTVDVAPDPRIMIVTE